MEEKDLEPREITELQPPAVNEVSEPRPVEPIQSVEVSAPIAEGPRAASEDVPAAEAQQAETAQGSYVRPAEPSLRERLRGAVLEQQGSPVKVSGFMRSAGLFENYEITNEKQMPFFMRVFAASALLHLLVFATAMQLPVVVETTCESTEFTQRLCDTMYVASLLRPDRVWVDQDYDPTQIPDAAINPEDVTMITAENFGYPEGYWTLRDEIEGRIADETVTPALDGAPFTFGNSNSTTTPPPEIDLSRPQNLPKQRKGAVTGNDIDNVFKTSPGPQPPLSGGGRKVTDSGEKVAGKNPAGIPEPNANNSNTNANTNPNTTAQNPKAVSPLPEGALNKKALYDFRDKLVAWREDGQNNFYQQFQYSLAGTIDNDGKLVVDEKTIQFGGDPKMQEILKLAIASFSDSGLLKAVKDLQSKAVKITMMQDGNQFLVRLETQQGNEKDARRLYNSISVALGLAQTYVSAGVEAEPDPKNKQKEMTTLELLKMAELKRDATNVIIDLKPSNKFTEDMYQTYKKELEEKKTNPTPEGVAVNANRDLGTAK
jgi:hypothetical protein